MKKLQKLNVQPFGYANNQQKVYSRVSNDSDFLDKIFYLTYFVLKEFKEKFTFSIIETFQQFVTELKSRTNFIIKITGTIKLVYWYFSPTLAIRYRCFHSRKKIKTLTFVTGNQTNIIY